MTLLLLLSLTTEDFAYTVKYIQKARLAGCEAQAKALVKEGISSENYFMDAEGEGDAFAALVECMENK